MTALNWLICANIALWLGLGAYLAYLARHQKQLLDRVRQWGDRHE